MLYIILFVLLLGGGIIFKLAVGIIRIVLIIIVLMIMAGVAIGTRDDAAVPASPVTTNL